MRQRGSKIYVYKSLGLNSCRQLYNGCCYCSKSDGVIDVGIQKEEGRYL